MAAASDTSRLPVHSGPRSRWLSTGKPTWTAAVTERSPALWHERCTPSPGNRRRRPEPPACRADHRLGHRPDRGTGRPLAAVQRTVAAPVPRRAGHPLGGYQRRRMAMDRRAGRRAARVARRSDRGSAGRPHGIRRSWDPPAAPCLPPGQDESARGGGAPVAGAWPGRRAPGPAAATDQAPAVAARRRGVVQVGRQGPGGAGRGGAATPGPSRSAGGGAGSEAQAAAACAHRGHAGGHRGRGTALSELDFVRLTRRYGLPDCRTARRCG